MKTQAQVDAKKAYQAKWRAENATKRAEANRRWREENAESIRLKKAAYAAANPEAIQAQNARKAAKYLENAEAERAKRRKFRQDNREKVRAQAAAGYERNRETVLAYAAEHRARNKEAIRASKARNKAQADAYAIRYRQENAEALKVRSREWHNAHPEVRLAATARRRAGKLARTPKWDVELTDLAVKEAAHLTRVRGLKTGFSWHVDHVIPLQGRYVSGLHTWSNLRVIPASVNRRKSNFFQPH